MALADGFEMSHRKAGVAVCAVAAVTALLAHTAQAEGDVALPAPFDSYRSGDVAAQVFGVLANRRAVRLTDARLWGDGENPWLAVVAEAARSSSDRALCDCPRPVRLALLRQDGGQLRIGAAALVRDVRDGTVVSLTSDLLDGSLGDNGVFRLTGAEQLLPVVLRWDAGSRPRAALALYRLRGRGLVQVFERRILDDPTVADPNASGMRARLHMGEFDPGGVAGFADIRFVERYFTRFDNELVALDDRRIEIWVFGGDRYSLVQCELTGPMGYGACVQ